MQFSSRNGHSNGRVPVPPFEIALFRVSHMSLTCSCASTSSAIHAAERRRCSTLVSQNGPACSLSGLPRKHLPKPASAVQNRQQASPKTDPPVHFQVSPAGIYPNRHRPFRISYRHFTTLIILLSFRPPCKTLSKSNFTKGNELLVKNKIQNYMEDIAARFTVHMEGTL